MNKTLKIITIIGVLCMLVPFMVLGSFASAETIQDDNFVYEYYNFRSLAGIGADNSTVYSFFTDNRYFGYNTLNPNFADAFFELPEVSYDLNLNGASISVNGINSMFRPAFFNNSSTANGRMNIVWDSANGKLHSYFLLVVVYGAGSLPLNSDLEDCFYFNGLTLYNHGCSSVQLTESFIEDDGIYLAGSNSLVEGSINPSFSYYSFINSLYDYTSLLDFYVLTWYGLPTEGNTLYPNESVFPANLFVVSFVDMSYEALGYTQGYEEGVTVGQQQGYDEGFTVGEQQGFDEGVIAGKRQANNTVNTGSASYIKGYQDGLDAPEYSFMSLISAILDAPIRAFFGYTENGVTHPGLFNFNIFGYDMSSLVLSIFSLCVLLTILRLILGGK